MESAEQFVVFSLLNQRYGVPLTTTERVVRMVEIAPLPGAPEFVRGVINVQGAIVPVINLRRRFGLPDRAPGPGDQLLITCQGRRKFALHADRVSDVSVCTERMHTDAEAVYPDLPFLAGISRCPDGLILLLDMEALLSSSDTRLLDRLMTTEPAQNEITAHKDQQGGTDAAP